MNTHFPILLRFQTKDYGYDIRKIDLAILLNADLYWNFSVPRNAFTEKKEKLENVGEMNESVCFTFDLNDIPILEYLLKPSKVLQNNGCWFYNFLITNVDSKKVEILWLLQEGKVDNSLTIYYPTDCDSFRITSTDRKTAELMKIAFPSTMRHFNACIDLFPQSRLPDFIVDEEFDSLRSIGNIYAQPVAFTRKLTGKAREEVDELEDLLSLVETLENNMKSFEMSYNNPSMHHTVSSTCGESCSIL
jgi:hypothetical protein